MEENADLTGIVQKEEHSSVYRLGCSALNVIKEVALFPFAAPRAMLKAMDYFERTYSQRAGDRAGLAVGIMWGAIVIPGWAVIEYYGGDSVGAAAKLGILATNVVSGAYEWTHPRNPEWDIQINSETP